MGVDLIGTIFGPLIGIVGGYLTKEQAIKEKKIDNEQKLAEFKHEVEMRAQERIASQEKNEQAMALNKELTESDLAKTELTKSYDGLLASIKADSELKTGPIMTNFRASVRPVLTYLGVIATTAMCFVAMGKEIGEVAAYTIYTDTSMMIAWWFGARDNLKLNNKYFK